MKNTTIHKGIYTREEYLALEAQNEFRSEYYEGEIFAMAGGSWNHNLIATNVSGELRNLLRDKDCIAMNSELKICLNHSDSYVYPDVSVVCGQPDYHDDRVDIITNPTIVIEVLSPSTADFDRQGKFLRYIQLPSLEEYVIIDSREIFVQVFKRQLEGKWLTTLYKSLDSEVVLETIEVSVPMREIYFKVEFEQT